MRVNDRLIRSVVRQGARTCEQVAQACGAGDCCGGCRPAIDEIVREERGGSSPEIRFLNLEASGSGA
jgi:bacterioferritin-associated ferredoxin